MLLAADPLFVLALVSGFAAISGLVWYFSPYRRNLRAIRAARRVRVADAPAGELVRIDGTVIATGATLSAPLSGRACVHFELLVERRVRTGKNSHWRALLRERDTRDFAVEDEGGGRALVEITSLETSLVQDHHRRSGTLNDATPELEALLARHGHSSTNFLGLNETIRYREAVLEPGEPIAIVGWAAWEDDPTPGALDPAGGYRSGARKKRLVLAPSPARSASPTTPRPSADRPGVETVRQPRPVREPSADRPRNHSAIPSMCGSKSPGTDTLRTPARSPVRFSKSWGVPPGAITSEPLGASIHSPPTRKLMVPSITKKTSSSSCACAPGPRVWGSSHHSEIE